MRLRGGHDVRSIAREASAAPAASFKSGLWGSLRFAGFRGEQILPNAAGVFLISRKLDSQSCAQRPEAPRPEMVFFETIR